MEYKSYRFVDRKARWIIVDESEKIINRNPSKYELKGLEKEPTKKYKLCTDEELLYYLIQFYEENGRIPVMTDFENNHEYPHSSTYIKRFGSWIAALKFVGLDVDLMGKQCDSYRGRIAEIKVINHFKQHPIDLAGENCNSPCDGVCPNGKTYDVKSSKLRIGGYYSFSTTNKYKDEIEIYYFLGFNEDWTKLMYAWRVPGDIVEGTMFHIGLNSWSHTKFTVENMKEYDITDKINRK